MTKIPPPPKKEKISFPNPDAHEQKTNLHQEIRQTLLQIREILPNPKDKDTIFKFINCINPGSGDITRLPYVANKPTAKYANKSACMIALVSWIIQKYWDYCIGDLSIRDIIMPNLLDLQDVAKKGLNVFKLVGNPAAGYSLEWKK